jgi:hypothetical protein
MDYHDTLRTLKPGHEFFVGIDSDGCVFDSMEVKQKEFFIPLALRHFNLFPVSRVVRETWEFVNLYSVYRGGNRFPSLVRVFDLLSERKEIAGSDIELPDLSALKEWIKTETKLSNAKLRSFYESTRDMSLEPVLKWSEEVNREIGTWLRRIPPYPYAAKTIETLSGIADIMVVSQTPLEALEREWLENDLKKYAMMIAAQEHGTKTEHISLAAKEKYRDEKILLIGDAYGDLNAAMANGILFYPVIPGDEDNSWREFLENGIQRFTSGTFAGLYQDNRIAEFKKSLPETPHWKK